LGIRCSLGAGVGFGSLSICGRQALAIFSSVSIGSGPDGRGDSAGGSQSASGTAARRIFQRSDIKQAVNELLEETGKFQNPIEQAFPIMADWQSQIIGQNPQRMCLEPDFSRSLREQIGTIANRLDSTQREISSIYEANGIDGIEFNKIFGSPLGGPGPNGYAVAAQALRNYSRDINPVMDRSISCDNLLKSISMLITFSNMTKALDQFSLWISEAKNNLSNYRNNLRKELRDAP
jgi:hypothetical protein